jgi:cell division protein ZapA (FtsZ GTPase activity inhibitor)
MKNFNPESIKVEIFNTQYSIKPTEELTEEDIRELAMHVDQMMRQMSERMSSLGYDKHDIAILVALNIASQMHKEQKRYEQYILQLVQMMDDASEEESHSDSPHASSPFDIEHLTQIHN